PDRRAFGRLGAYTRDPYDRQDPGTEGELPAHGADGGAELQPGDPHRRPRLRDRARQDRVRGPLERGSRQQRADPQALHGIVMERAAVKTIVLVVGSAIGGIIVFIAAIAVYMVYKVSDFNCPHRVAFPSSSLYVKISVV